MSVITADAFQVGVVDLWNLESQGDPDNSLYFSKGRVAVPKTQNPGIAKRVGVVRGVGPIPRFLGGFYKVYRGQPKVIMGPQK